MIKINVHNIMKASGGQQEIDLQNVVDSSAPETLTFTCKEFRMTRFLLRLLSLWRPQTAGIFERFIYPAIVNLMLLLLGPVLSIILATHRPTRLSIQYVYLVHEIGIWLGHILGNFYFRSRDLENNVLPQVQTLIGIRKPLKRKLKYLNVAMLVSISLFSLMLCTVYIAPKMRWNHGAKRFSSGFPNVHATLDHIIYVFVILLTVYDLGIGLALAWTMALLHVCFASRLKTLEDVYLKWEKSSQDAVHFFQQVYSRPIKISWERISWWFLVHNIIVIAVPLYGYEVAQAISGTAYHSKHLSQFICYLIFVITVWLAPIVMAEQIKRREIEFQERVNDFCPGLLKKIEDDGERRKTSGFVWSGANEEEDHQKTTNDDNYTFASRGKELRDFLSFLKNRTPGLVSRGYTFQLNLSLVALFTGLVSFLLNLHRED